MILPRVLVKADLLARLDSKYLVSVLYLDFKRSHRYKNCTHELTPNHPFGVQIQKEVSSALVDPVKVCLSVH